MNKIRITVRIDPRLHARMEAVRNNLDKPELMTDYVEEAVYLRTLKIEEELKAKEQI